MLKHEFPMSLLFFVILYSVWHRVWHRMPLQNYVTLSTASQSFQNNLKLSINHDSFYVACFFTALQLSNYIKNLYLMNNNSI